MLSCYHIIAKFKLKMSLSPFLNNRLHMKTKTRKHCKKEKIKKIREGNKQTKKKFSRNTKKRKVLRDTENSHVLAKSTLEYCTRPTAQLLTLVFFHSPLVDLTIN